MLILAGAAALPRAQQEPAATGKRVLTVEDYTKWRTITGQEISSDGNWAAYVLSLTNVVQSESKPVLHLVRLDSGQQTEVANATAPAFSADSKWIAYQVDPSGGRGGRGRRGARRRCRQPTGRRRRHGGAAGIADRAAAGQSRTGDDAAGQNPATSAPPSVPAGNTAGYAADAAHDAAAATTPPEQPTRIELRNLATGAVKSWQDMQGFVFSPNSTFVVLKRRPANANGGRGAGAANGGDQNGGQGGAQANAAPAGPRGTDVILHNLATGRDQLLGSVGDIAFNKTGDLLAYTVDAAVKDGNGLFVMDLASGRIQALDNDAKNYNRLTWSEDGKALAVLKGADVDKMRERDNVVLAFTDVKAALTDAEAQPAALDPAKAATFPKGWVVSDRAGLEWSDDDKRVFFGAKPQLPAPDTAPRKSTDEQANVDVWNTSDERVQSLQMARADQDCNFTFREAFDVPAAKFVKLADETMRDVDVAPDGRWAVGRDTRGYISDYKRPAADIYRVNTTTGERTLMLKNQMINTSTGSHTFGVSPDGRFFLYWKDARFQAYDLDAGTSKTLGGGVTASFVDPEFDHPGPKPAVGVAGYTADKKSVIVEQRYDLWALPLDGSNGRSLTNGAGSKGEIRLRYVRTLPLDPNLGNVNGAAGAGGPGGGGFGGGRGGECGVARDD